jgi:hypothetical protein
LVVADTSDVFEAAFAGVKIELSLWRPDLSLRASPL